MRIVRPLLVCAVAGLGLAPTSPADAEGNTVRFVADLKGEEATPLPGPPGSSGKIVLDGNPSTGKVCYTLTYNGPGEPTDLHIHRAPKGATGPVTIPLRVGKDCVDAEPAEVQALIEWPGGPDKGYYVDVHTVAYQFPNGVVRGQTFFG